MVALAGIVIFPSVSNPLNSSSCFRCATIRSYLPFPKKARLIDGLRCGGVFSYKELSIVCSASNPKNR